jgi:hypothetical protein
VTRFQRIILCTLAASGVGYADNLTWTSAGNNVWSIFYVSPYTALDTTTGQTLQIFCIDYNHDIAPPQTWTANVVPLSSTNLSQYQFGGSYPGVSPLDTTAASAFAFQSQTTTSGGSTVTANLSTSGSMDRYLELAWLATQMETALSDGQQGKITTAAMDAALDVYQVADWLIFADASPSQFAPGMTHIADLENRVAGTSGGFSYNSTLGLWSSAGSGYDFQYAVDSALNSAENAVVNNGWSSSQFSVVTASQSWDASNNGGVPLQEFLVLTPTTGSSLTPVPEPSQLVLLFTVIALTGLAARRVARKRRATQIR